MQTLLGQYINGGYKVTIHSDGTKIRETIDASIPPVHPEQMDLKITDWCDAGCAWCHEKSTIKGKAGDLKASVALLSTLPRGVEIAIGGGDPLSHPDFEWFVETLTEQGLVCSVTVNAFHFEKHLPRLKAMVEKNHIKGIGYSFDGKTMPSWDYEHLVVHLITGVHDPVPWMKEGRRRKLLLLGFKDFGRGAAFKARVDSSVEETKARWYRALSGVAKVHALSFDNLAIEQLKPRRLFLTEEDYKTRHMGEEGQFSMYVDGVTQTSGLSSYHPVREKWTDINAMFQRARVLGAEEMAKASHSEAA